MSLLQEYIDKYGNEASRQAVNVEFVLQVLNKYLAVTDGDLQEALAAETRARQETDETLHEGISAEVQARQEAGNYLRNLIEGINASLAGEIQAKANIASPVFTGVPKVPSKTSVATSDGTLVATEAQVALKANTASPALIGTPTAPTAAAKNNSIQIATTAYADRAGHPVGSYYTQYPVPGQSTLDGMFPSSESPATLFGGTWTEMYGDEQVFFKGGVASAETSRGKAYNESAQSWIDPGAAGIQHDAIRNITGEIKGYGSSKWGTIIYKWGNAPELTFSGAFRKGTYNTEGLQATSASNSGPIVFDASGSVPVDSDNHPRNRIIKVWKRAA